MRNPFSAIGNAFAKAGQAVTGAIGKAIGGTGKAISKAGGALTRTGEKLSTPKAPKAPKSPPAVKAPAAPPAGKAPAAPPKAPAPTSLPPAPPPEGKRAPKLPPTDFGPGTRSGGAGGTSGGISGGMSQDERILGTDSDATRDLREAIKEFEADHRTNLLGDKAQGFLNQPNFSAIFNKYSTGSGWTRDQWFKGMSNARDFRIEKIAGGKIQIEFDADFDIDDYTLGTRTVSATF